MIKMKTTCDQYHKPYLLKLNHLLLLLNVQHASKSKCWVPDMAQFLEEIYQLLVKVDYIGTFLSWSDNSLFS